MNSLGTYLGRKVAIKQFNEYSMSFRLEDFYKEVALLRYFIFQPRAFPYSEI